MSEYRWYKEDGYGEVVVGSEYEAGITLCLVATASNLSKVNCEGIM
jgi:hypothetical protein